MEEAQVDRSVGAAERHQQRAGNRLERGCRGYAVRHCSRDLVGQYLDINVEHNGSG